MGKRPINSVKRIIDTTSVLTGGLPVQTTFANAVASRSDPFQPADLVIGETFNGIFVSVFVIGSSGTVPPSAIDWFIIKIHSGQAGSIPNGGQTGTSELRNQIIHEEKGLSGSGDGTPMAFKGVIVIPKGMRRMREGDEWRLVVQSLSQGAVDLNVCVKVIYKSYF